MIAFGSAAASADVFSDLYAFTGSDSAYQQGPLIVDAGGNLFGTSPYGGRPGQGSVFELPPGGNGVSLQVLYEFTGGSDGAQPFGGLVSDPAGNLYGVASAGGTTGNGTVFELVRSGSVFTFQVLYQFSGDADGGGPVGTLVIDTGGILYGTTEKGGAGGSGTVFSLSPGESGFVLTTLHAFSSTSSGVNADGAQPGAPLLLDELGTLFGTTQLGGPSADGVVFALVPGPSGYRFSVVHAFDGTDGMTPMAGLIEDRGGDLFGTTSGDPAIARWGTVFELENRRGTYAFHTLHTFTDGTDGATPISILTFGPAGDLFGTASAGGAADAGTIFDLYPSTSDFTFRALYDFTAGFDGATPASGLVFGPDGRLYGDTVFNGFFGWGTIFAYTPPPTAAAQIVRIAAPAPVAIDLAASDPALSGAAFTFAIVSPPAHGALSPISGASVTYTPNGSFAGTDTFTFTATDASGTSNPAAVTIALDAPAKRRVVPAAPAPPAAIGR
ncbi:MAG TPA: choice-of-anchor tandem repeat GloVer-containing protein [Thermoanaerobaculia bacterium]|nr:choice-of-anchor tandem repeat GloVer-containing protein [Thermoanaerobaculia bacterium]